MTKRYEPSPEITAHIIEMYRCCISGTDIAKEFNVSPPTIYSLLKRLGAPVNKDAESKYAKYGNPSIATFTEPPLNDFYVYLHRSSEDNSIFYVGKGRKNRFKSKGHRGSAWKAKSSCGYYCEFHTKDLTEAEAITLESKLIKEIPNLVNCTPASKLPFSVEDYQSTFAVDPESPSGLSRIKASYHEGSQQGKIGHCGWAACLYGKQYWKVKFRNKGVMVHRIIWSLLNGEIPDNFVIDHLDGDGLNNKLDNIRLVSKAKNAVNKSKSKANTSGQTGVFRFREGTLTGWRVILTIDSDKVSKRFYDHKLGEEEAFRLACEWRKEQIRLLNEQGAGYTERHGT